MVIYCITNHAKMCRMKCGNVSYAATHDVKWIIKKFSAYKLILGECQGGRQVAQ